MATVQETIISMMNKRNMSQAELSRLSGVSKSSLSRYLSGDEMPASKLLAIANALDVTVDKILGIEHQSSRLSTDEDELLRLFRRMDADGRAELLEYAEYIQARHPLNQGVESRSA